MIDVCVPPPKFVWEDALTFVMLHTHKLMGGYQYARTFLLGGTQYTQGCFEDRQTIVNGRLLEL